MATSLHLASVFRAFSPCISNLCLLLLRVPLPHHNILNHKCKEPFFPLQGHTHRVQGWDLISLGAIIGGLDNRGKEMAFSSDHRKQGPLHINEKKNVKNQSSFVKDTVLSQFKPVSQKIRDSSSERRGTGFLGKVKGWREAHDCITLNKCRGGGMGSRPDAHLLKAAIPECRKAGTSLSPFFFPPMSLNAPNVRGVIPAANTMGTCIQPKWCVPSQSPVRGSELNTHQER